MGLDPPPFEISHFPSEAFGERLNSNRRRPESTCGGGHRETAPLGALDATACVGGDRTSQIDQSEPWRCGNEGRRGKVVDISVFSEGVSSAILSLGFTTPLRRDEVMMLITATRPGCYRHHRRWTNRGCAGKWRKFPVLIGANFAHGGVFRLTSIPSGSPAPIQRPPSG